LKRPFLIPLFLTLLLTVLGFAVLGYHPGVEDDAVYLSAVKAAVHPALYSHNAAFFKLQLQATLFDEFMALFVSLSGLSVAWAELLCQFFSLFAVLWACRSIAAKLFESATAQWAGVTAVSALFALPVTGTALTLADQYPHPRLMATACILFAIDAILARNRWRPAPLLLVALLLHPLMAAFGVSFCIFLMLALFEPLHERLRFGLRMPPDTIAAAAPLGWIVQSPTPSWMQALGTRRYYFLSNWAWYEWLGALAPFALFWALWQWAHRRMERLLDRVALAVFAYAVFQFLVAALILNAPALVRLVPLQPMRFLHLVYFFMVLIGGCFLGRFVLRLYLYRWAIFLVLLYGGMYLSQRALFPSSPHIEWPGRASSNPWLQAFDWVRQNTPEDAYFALDPNAMAVPGEDYHSFRALAERSQLADNVKDPAVATQVPELAPIWQHQVDEQYGWPHLTPAVFQQLRSDYGVDWVLIQLPAPAGLNCVWHNSLLAACTIPYPAPGLVPQSPLAPGGSFRHNSRQHSKRRHTSG
jgi:hypothetical protein